MGNRQMSAHRFYKDTLVLVTGASGLLGQHLVAVLLESGARVRAAVHRRPLTVHHPCLEVVRSDLTQQGEADRVMAGVEMACLTASVTVGAAEAIRNPMGAVTPNLILAARSLEAACLAHVRRVLLVSSTTVYPPYARPVREEEAFEGEPYSAYQGVGNMKRYVESLAQFYHDKYGMQIAIVRPVPFYGPHDNFDFETCHVIPALIRKAVEKQTPFEVWGTGKEIRDFLHVEDVARGCLLALERSPECEALNLGSGRSVSVKELAQLITRLAGHEAPLTFNDSRPSTIPIRLVDVSKARASIGFEAAVSLEDGLAKTIRWFATHRESGRPLRDAQRCEAVVR